MRIPLTRYGLREMLVALLICGGLLALAVCLFAPAAVAPGLGILYVLSFFRDPQRTAPTGAVMVSPADGYVADITPLAADSPLGVEGVRVGVFMTLVSVHVNRSPCRCTVRRVEHAAGGYLDARKPEAAELNESSTIYLSCRCGGVEHPLIVRQVAGLVARRIVTDLSPGRTLAAGERIGMIKFGSRAELWVPKALVSEVAVRVGQKVRGGLDVLVRLNQETAE